MDYNTEHFNTEETIDIKKFLIKILNNWYWFAITLFVSLTIAYAINRYTKPIYSVSSSIIVRDDEKNRGLSGQENVIKGLELFQTKKNIQNEIGILQSYVLTNRTLRELDFSISYVGVGRSGMKENELYRNSPFVVHLDTSKTNQFDTPINITILSKDEYRLEIDGKKDLKKVLKFGQVFENEDYCFFITLRDREKFNLGEKSNKYYFVINDLNSLTNIYRAKLNIALNDKKGSILILGTKGASAQQEVDFLNKLGEVYIKYGLEEKNQTAINTLKFIDDQLGGIVDSLRSAEENLLEFRTSNKIIDLDKEGSAIFDQLALIQGEKTQLTIKAKYYDYLLNYIKTKDNFKELVMPSVMGIDDILLNSLVGKLADLYAQKTILLYTTKENNPALNLLSDEMQNTKNSLIENVTNIINAAKIAMNDVDARLAEINKQIERLPATTGQLVRIQRTFNFNDQIYNYLMQKRAEAGIAKASNVPDNKVLDEARVDNAKQVLPKKSLNYMISLIIGLMIPLIIIVLADFLNNKILDIKDVENKTSVALLGAIGHSTKESELPVFENPKSAIAESFRSIRTNLQYMLTTKDQKVISITSTLSGEGKTFCAVNLATIIAMSNKKTLLMGLDLRKPKIHNVFNFDNEIGISTYLINKSTFEETVRLTNINNLYVALSGPVPPNPAELIETDRMREFIETARKEFDYIVIDTSPIAIVTDALLLAQYSDINVFVVRQGFTSKDVLKLVEDLFNRKNLKHLCLLVNDIKAPGYYGYGYGFGYGYGGYGYGYNSDGYYGDDAHSEKLFNKILRILRIRMKT
jgi:tyrosine-protein kinase Etk/Wzc